MPRRFATPAEKARQLWFAAVLGSVYCGSVAAQSALLTDTGTIAAPTVAAPVEHSFTTSAAGTYKATLTDLGAGLPAPTPLSSLKAAVTQGGTIVGTLLALNGPTGTLSFTAAANTAYTLHIVGKPANNVSSGTLGVAIAAPDGSSFQDYVDSIALPTPAVASTEAIVSDTFTVSTAGTYTVALTDLALPTQLQTLVLALIPSGGSPLVTLPDPQTQAMQATLPLTAGSYQVIAIGKTSATAAGGLFSVAVSGASGTPPYPAKTVPVGAVTLAGTATPSSAGPYTFTLADLAFPAALAQVGAALVAPDGTSVVTPLATGGTQTFTAAAGAAYQAFALGIPAASPGLGSYSVVVAPSGGGMAASSVARAVSTQAANLPTPYSFDASIASAGSYKITLTDFLFPTLLTSARLAAVQNGTVIGTPLTAPGSFTTNAAQGPLTLIAFGAAGASGALMGVDVSPAGGGAPAFDASQGVGAAFKTTQFNVPSAQSLQVNASDLGFPASLATLSLAVTQGTNLVGSLLSAGSSGSFTFQASAGTYTLNVVAQAAAPDNAGTYFATVAPPPPAPVVTLTAASTSVSSGQAASLTWSAQNATTCTASGGLGWSGSKDPAGGTLQTSPLSADTTFSLSCTGAGGTTSKSVTVTIAAPASKGGGGGSIGWTLLLGLSGALALKPRRRVTLQ